MSSTSTYDVREKVAARRRRVSQRRLPTRHAHADVNDVKLRHLRLHLLLGTRSESKRGGQEIPHPLVVGLVHSVKGKAALIHPVQRRRVLAPDKPHLPRGIMMGSS